jgi:RNA polymerase sigma-70 factor (ECF subfamily)
VGGSVVTRKYVDADEADLVAWAQEGDERAFEALVTPQRGILLTVCGRICGNDQDALDAVQVALLAAWQHLGAFRGGSKFSTWLYRIAHNAALAHLRRRIPEPVGDLPLPLAAGPGIESQVSDVQAVRWALARIPPDFRAALVLREYADLTYEEIAAVQRIRVETVKTRIARARQAMARLLSDRVA